MLKITEINRTKENVTLKLEGRIGGEWINEIQLICEKTLAEALILTLDLADVSFIERQAVPLFRELKNRQVTFAKCSPFLCEQLKGIQTLS